MSEYSFSRPDEIPDPVPVAVVAQLLGIAVSSVYASCHRFLAAQRDNDLAAMRRAIPCYMIGGRIDENGNSCGGRIVIPREALVGFHKTATLGLAAVEELYGEAVTV